MQEAWYEVLDPTVDPQRPDFSAAPRLETLAGAPIGYLDNNKWNVEPLLRSLHARLEKECEVERMSYARKRLFSQPAPPETYDLLKREAAAVVTAIGD